MYVRDIHVRQQSAHIYVYSWAEHTRHYFMCIQYLFEKRFNDMSTAYIACRENRNSIFCFLAHNLFARVQMLCVYVYVCVCVCDCMHVWAAHTFNPHQYLLIVFKSTRTHTHTHTHALTPAPKPTPTPIYMYLEPHDSACPAHRICGLVWVWVRIWTWVGVCVYVCVRMCAYT